MLPDCLILIRFFITIKKSQSINKCTNNYEHFVNVFNAIDNMLDTYKSDLKNIDIDMSDAPECLKVEKTTVLRNLIKTLDYLKNLKK